MRLPNIFLYVFLVKNKLKIGFGVENTSLLIFQSPQSLKSKQYKTMRFLTLYFSKTIVAGDMFSTIFFCFLKKAHAQDLLIKGSGPVTFDLLKIYVFN